MKASQESEMTEIANLQHQLRRLTHEDVLENWRVFEGDLPCDRALNPQTWQSWSVASLNARRHIPWLRGKRVLWLSQTLVVPQSLNHFDIRNFALRLSLRWWADDAQIYINGKLVQAGDLFDCFGRIPVTPKVTPGDTFYIALRLLSPGHDDGALVTSELIYESEGIDPGFIADELAVCAALYPEQFATQSQDYLNRPDWQALPENCDRFLASLCQLHNQLKNDFPKPESILYLMGHAHLDMAWLWDVEDTWKAAERTFASVLSLQQDFPELIFSHSSAALYEWIERHRPDLFEQICDRVRAGVWEVASGLWVEPELNLISGESILRQILYAQKYNQAKFNQIVRVAWLPDSFGFCWQLPQLLKQGGIEYFVTQKLRWNDTTEFPHELFWWESPDGTQILSLMSAHIGQTVEPKQMAEYLASWQEKTNLPDGLWLPGVGDHGGGPTRDMLEVARRWRESPVFPNLEFSSSEMYLDRISQQIAHRTQNLPVWRDELYLEYHRGCYTTHGDRKLANRRGERLLYQAELFASLASKATGVPYPHEELETAWKALLFDQFHDILPGSAIPEVFEAADRASAELTQTALSVRETAIATLTQQIPLPPPPHPEAKPIYVVNPLNWTRSHVVAVLIPNLQQSWQVCDFSGNSLPVQQSNSQLYFLAEAVPGVGCRVFWLYPGTRRAQPSTLTSQNSTFCLENANLRVNIDSGTGNLSQILDKRNQQQVLGNKGGNRLEAFRDKGQYWDAWNIDPDYERYRLDSPVLEQIEWVTFGELRQQIRVVRRLGNSRFIQDYSLDKNSEQLRIENQVDWQEEYIFVKAAFDFSFETDTATYEMPCGAIQRPTRPQTPAEAAKWEVPAMQWGDLSNENFGVSLLNDCKYGYDAKPQQLRLSLLRGSQWPHPQADNGEHHFAYAIYPHAGDALKGGTVQRGYEFNQPLEVRVGNVRSQTLPSSVPENVSDSLPWLSVECEHFVLMALKQAETRDSTWILRGYETGGQMAKLQIQGCLPWQGVSRVDALEREISQNEGQNCEETIAPWQVVSFHLK